MRNARSWVTQAVARTSESVCSVHQGCLLASGEPNPKAPFREEKELQSSDGVGFVWGIVSKIRERFRTTCLGTRGFASAFSRARAFVSHQRTVAQMPASAAISFRAPIAAPLRARASARRVHARRAVVAALPQKGKTALTGVLRVPKSEEAKMDAMWESHEKYMRDTHVIAGGPETTDEKPRVWSTTSQRRSSSPTPPTPVRPHADTPRPLSRHPMPPLERASPRQTFRENITFSGGTRTLRIGTSETARSSTVPRSSRTEPDDPCPFLHRRRLNPHG